jgi:hypothetical protein
MIKPFPKPPQPNLQRLPWRQRVTLCVAAECQRHKRFFNAVVFASDFEVEGGIASAEIGVKVAMASSEEYPILMAGTQTRAINLAQIVAGFAEQQHAPPDKDSLPLHWDAILEDSVRLAKHKVAEELVSSRFGISYQQFLANGKTSFPDDIFRETIAEIGRTSLDCWLIVLGFHHSDPMLYRISDIGTVETCQNFAAIGSGSYIAEASLFQRSQRSTNDLGTTIYNVYEAMRLGAIAPGVGKKFEIGIAEWDWYEKPNPHNRGEVKISYLEPQYYKYLDKRFGRFGPKTLTAVRLKPRFIKARQRALVLTPKGAESPDIQRDIRRTKAAREREARKRAARPSGSQTSKDRQ